MSMHKNVKKLITHGSNHQKSLIFIFCFVTCLVLLSPNHVHRVQFEQKGSLQTTVVNSRLRDEDRSFEIKSSTSNYKASATTPRPTVVTQETLAKSSLSGKRNSNANFINFQDMVNSNLDKITFNRVPLIDNTSNYRNNNKSNANAFTNTGSINNRISVEDFIQNSKTGNRTMVLLLTYLRSGSTFTADIIQQASDVFYLYEPLKGYLRGQHYFTLDSVCHIINGTCRKPSGHGENIDNVLDDLSKFYNCDFFHVPRFYFRFSNKSKTMLQYDRCRHHRTQYHCIKEFQEKCTKSIAMIKTIRMNLDVAEKLLEEFPNLKIIHLIRDPRGSYQSRKNGQFLRKQSDLEAITKSNCDTLHSNLQIGFRLKKLYSERIKTIMYETLAEQPLDAARSIFRFLGLTEPLDFEQWVKEHTRAGYSNGYYDTVRRNSARTAYLWRKYINFKVVQSFDKNCQNVYDILGINPLTSYTDLHNSSIPARHPSPFFDDFLS